MEVPSRLIGRLLGLGEDGSGEVVCRAEVVCEDDGSGRVSA